MSSSYPTDHHLFLAGVGGLILSVVQNLSLVRLDKHSTSELYACTCSCIPALSPSLFSPLF